MSWSPMPARANSLLASLTEELTSCRSQHEGHAIHGASLAPDERWRSIILVAPRSVKGAASFGTYGATKAAVRNLVRT